MERLGWLPHLTWLVLGLTLFALLGGLHLTQGQGNGLLIGAGVVILMLNLPAILAMRRTNTGKGVLLRCGTTLSAFLVVHAVGPMVL